MHVCKWFYITAHDKGTITYYQDASGNIWRYMDSRTNPTYSIKLKLASTSLALKAIGEDVRNLSLAGYTFTSDAPWSN